MTGYQFGTSGGLRERLRAGDTAYGIFCGLGSAAAVEVCAAAGLDWVLVDLEHGAGSEADIPASVLAAAAYSVPALVRVETPDRIRIGRALDAGAAGVMVPRVESAAMARDVVSNMLYPPAGVRGAATYNRSARFGLAAHRLLPEASDKPLTIVQIETRGALDSVDDICRVDGVDVVFVGPLDLSFALGIPGQMEHPDFLAALKRVVAAAESAGKPAGILAGSDEALRRYRRLGFQFISLSSVSTIIVASLTRSLQILPSDAS